MDPVLEQVRDFADSAHGGQLRKYSPDRYIVHPVRVMECCAAHGATRAQQAAALLHDVLEDTRVTEEDLLRFLRTVMEEAEALHTLTLVVELTDVYTTSAYPKWKRRRRKEEEAERMRHISAEAQTIKYADILDNTLDITQNDPGFAFKFLRECRQLLRVMTAGDAELRAEAQALIARCIDSLPHSGRHERG
ncbi:HD domain-containing protein [Flaviaesturariibacter flavus]|uniref:HD domain-containing protein n=1 Tax=Flaviaesturariibacter flavus TaxID=2502780 RepID=A0A4R1BBQ6_9BACT|nr:HD domain-containing protein [Flaviaesturariibacter flavus]TCJ14455.1 HD domain-containing protein [Flaviaesturariibacter flavus]